MKHNLNAKRWCTNKRHGYLIALAGVFLAFALRYVLHPVLEGSLPLFFFQINTILIAFFFGFGPAILTVILSGPLLIFFFIEPFHEFSVLDQRDITTIIVYVSYTVVASVLVELLRREQYNAEMAFLVSESRFRLMLEGDQKIRTLLRKSNQKLH